MESFLTSFLMVLAAEMGDKTQFLVFSLALKYGGLPVFLGATLAFGILNGPGVYIGNTISNLLTDKLVGFISGAVFLIYGIYMLIVKEDNAEEATKSGKNGFLISFTTIFLGELGDKTQICSLVLGAKFKSFGIVFSGCFLALIIATGVGVFLGSKIQKLLPKVPFKKIAGLIMILTGMLGIFSVLIYNI